MPADQRALTRAARERAASTGETYTAARAALLAAHGTTTATIDPVLLAPYPNETGVVGVDELGWRVLPADATPQQRARAEANWYPVAPARPCRCSGSCLHATRCGHPDDGEDRCPGLLIHLDRYPGGLFAVDDWEDRYECVECRAGIIMGVELPAVPWGEPRDGGIGVFDDVRHPNFPDDEDQGSGYDPGCFECGAKAGYQCTCGDEPDTSFGCDECGAGGGYGCNC